MGLRAIEITGVLLQDLLTVGTTGPFEVTEGLPEDAEFRGSYAKLWNGIYLRATPTVVLLFEHPDFDDGMDGGAVPFMDVVFEERCCNKA